MNLRAATVGDQLCDFLGAVLSSQGPFDRVIPVERKGTASLRVFLSRQGRHRPFPRWADILSSNAIPLVHEADLRDQRILVFEEMTRSGHHITQALDQLSGKSVDVSRQVVVAAFAAGPDWPNGRFHSSAYYRSLTQGQYEAIRASLIGVLQQEGSLLLDTEHPEIVVRIECTVADFLSALAACGEIVVFESGAGKLNITICEPKLFRSDTQRLGEYLPTGTRLEGVVKKVRVVQRAPNLFAVTPIYYPDVPDDTEPGWYDRIPEFARGDTKHAIGRFYTVGLLAAVELLGPVWAAVKARLRDQVTAFVGETPSGDDTRDHASGSFDHLRALWPHLDVDGLRAHVNTVMHRAVQHGYPLTSSKQRRDVVSPSTRSLRSVALRLAQHLLEESEFRSSEPSGLPEDVMGLTYGEVTSLARRMNRNLPGSAVSAALDLLIDYGCAVTRVERRENPARHLRTFQIDGEIVTSKLRNFTAVQGLQEIEWP